MDSFVSQELERLKIEGCDELTFNLYTDFLWESEMWF